MLGVTKSIKALALSTIMFGAGASVATVALSYLPNANATPIKVAQGLKQSKAEEVDEDNNLKFRFQDCKRGGKNVVCNVLTTNLKNENREIVFHAGRVIRGRIIDVDGNQYIGQLIVKGEALGDYNEVATNLIYGTPTKLSYIFEVPREVTKIAALEVNYKIRGNNYGNDYKVVIRDITIGGSQASNSTNPGTNCSCPPQTTPKRPKPR